MDFIKYYCYIALVLSATDRPYTFNASPNTNAHDKKESLY